MPSQRLLSRSFKNVPQQLKKLYKKWQLYKTVVFQIPCQEVVGPSKGLLRRCLCPIGFFDRIPQQVGVSYHADVCGHSPLEGNVAEWFRHSSLGFRIPAKAQPRFSLCCSSLPLCEAKFNQGPSLSGTLCTQGWTYVHVEYKTDACQPSWSISLGHNTKLFTNRMIPLNLLLNDISPPHN